MRNLFTNVQKHMMGRIDSNECTVCTSHTPDTNGHILGGCSHRIPHGLYCKRHGKAVKLILDTIRQSARGNCQIYADAEAEERTLNDIPTWFGLLSRPDILLFPNIDPSYPWTRLTHTYLPRRFKQAVIIEIGYTSDGDITPKYTTKQSQHARLVNHLTRKGWQVTTHTVLITYSGQITSNLRTLFESLNVNTQKINQTISKIQRSTLTYNRKILSSRRHILNTTARVAQPHTHNPQTLDPNPH